MADPTSVDFKRHKARTKPASEELRAETIAAVYVFEELLTEWKLAVDTRFLALAQTRTPDFDTASEIFDRIRAMILRIENMP